MYGVIDRFEGETAVIVLEESGRVLTVSAKVLPLGAREGDYIVIDPNTNEISLGREEKKCREEDVKKLMEEIWEE